MATALELRAPVIGDQVIFVLAKHHLEQTGNMNNGAAESPAQVVRVFGPGCVNLKVNCDGMATLWVTSAERGRGPGQWYFQGEPVEPAPAG